MIIKLWVEIWLAPEGHMGSHVVGVLGILDDVIPILYFNKYTFHKINCFGNMYLQE